MPFLEKLRMNSLYPSIPDRSGRENALFSKFMGSVAPRLRKEREQDFQRSRLGQIGQQALNMPNAGGNDRFTDPSVTKPMDVRFEKPLSDLVPLRTLGVGPGSITPYQSGQLGIKERALDISEDKLAQTGGIAQGNLAARNRQIAVQEFKAKNPSAKFLAPKGGRITAVNPVTGAVIADFGDTGTMSDEERIGLEQKGRIEVAQETGKQARETEGTRQTGRETLADIQARHAKELEGVKQSGRPIGTERIEQVRDAQGNIVGARSTKTQDTMPPKAPESSNVSIIDPSGIRRSIPAAQLAEAISRGAKKVP